MKPQLAKISKVDLREIWETEDKHFTPWLAEENNIVQLGETIGIDLEVESQEKNVGPFRADILAKDTSTNHFVLIENQLEITDHKHLGQIMTYAAGLDACSIIWIAKQFTEEHRAAIDWLNRITDEKINFFGIEIEVLRIGESAAAPQFKVVAKPNDWSRSVKKAASDADLSTIKVKQREYWTDLKNYVEKNGKPFKMKKPLAQHWTNIALGKSGFQLSLTVNSIKKEIGVALDIYTDNKDENKRYFKTLKDNYLEESYAKISQELQWNLLVDKKVSQVSLTKNFNFLDTDTQEEQFKWFLDTVVKFDKFFRPILHTLK